MTVGTQMFEMLRPIEQREELDDVRVPTRHVARQLFEHRGGTLATAIVDGFRNVGARRNRARWFEIRSSEVVKDRLRGLCCAAEIEIVQRDVANQVTDVRYYPLLAGLDEEVVPQLLRVEVKSVRLIRHPLQQCAQLSVVLRIGNAIERGQQFEQAIRIASNGCHSANPPVARSTRSCAGTSSHASSAGSTTPLPAGRAGSIARCGCN